MKYESTILKRLIDKYGVVGNPRYISEIINEFIVRGKESFPNLFTYQADWLAHIDEFGLNPSYTVSYTGQSIYAPNTLERPVKSAILKGQTENICDKFEQGSYQFSTSAGTITPTTPTNNRIRIKQPITGVNTLFKMAVNGNYQILLAVKDKDGRVTGTDWVNEINKNLVETDKLYFVLRKKDGTNITPNDLYTAITSVTGYDLFEMKYVRMPVLTTVGKNLLNTGFESGGLHWTEGYKIDDATMIRTINPINVNGLNSIYVWSEDLNDCKYIFTYDNNMNFLKIITNNGSQINLDNEVAFIHLRTEGTIKSLDHYQKSVVVSTSPITSYEPYKSNILTANEEVELRGIGDVKDELDCLTGELTQRIGEVVLNGSESWGTGLWGNQVEGIGFEMKIKNDVNRSVFVKAISDKILYNTSNNFQNDGEYFDMVGAGNGETWIRIRILRSKLSTEDVEGFKKWLSQNNVKILYELSDKPIKTVDLTILDQNGHNVKQLMSFNGGTHFNTGSLEGSLPPSVSVSVDTDLEETLKVCSLEGNTM